ncbi:MAG: DNA-binding transcriptional LysR family regulator [Flavobacteriales bacterium]|jgi:DNA-binding transcriptional LysR family regulator
MIARLSISGRRIHYDSEMRRGTKGLRLLQTSQIAFKDIESEIKNLREHGSSNITIGMLTYFASRWLSPRLITFIAQHPQIGLRIQPLINLAELTNTDMAIRCGKGDWFEATNVNYTLCRNSLVISDPNLRVQAVIDNQGIALNDRLVAGEVSNGQLFQSPNVLMNDYGYYLVYPKLALNQAAIKAFRDWIILEHTAPFSPVTC